MNLSAIFIKRPIATTLLALGLAAIGVAAFYFLPIAPLPQVDFPTISVQTNLPGASPEIMAASVAAPLERQIGRIAGITQLTSTSTLGSTNVIVQFDLSRNIDGAARDVQAAINAALSQLPADLPNNPTYRKVNPADAPIMVISLTSNIYSRGDMYDAATTMLQQKISQVNGIGQVVVGGSSLPAVRIELNPTALNNYGIGLEQVRTAIAASNANRPKGLLDTVNSTEIHTNDQLFKAYQYKPLIVAYRNNAPVRVSDIADVNDSVENVLAAALTDNTPAVVLIIYKQPGANVIDTVDKVHKIMPFLQASIPAGMNMNVIMDRTITIRASFHDVELTLLVAIILVVLVVFLFIGNVRTALIPSVAVPLSLLGTFGVMYLFNYSLDNLSLMALTISTGFVIDDAIVVLENITRHVEAGMHPLAAALQGSKEVGFTVLSMSTSLIAVFIPILFMGGLIGRLFREFAVTLSSAIVISLIISLTVTPMMCAHLIRQADILEKRTSIYKRLFAHVQQGYRKSLDWALRHVMLMLLITTLMVGLNIYLFVIIPKGFFPQQDTGRIIGSIQGQQDTSFQSMQRKLTAFVNIVSKDSAVQHVTGSIGGQNNTTDSGRMYVTLKALSQRKISTDDVINRLRSKLNTVPGASLYLQAAQDLEIGARFSFAQYQYTLSADNLEDLGIWAPQVMAQMKKLPGIIDVNSDQRNGGLQKYLNFDRDTAARFGITAQLIDNTLYDAFGQRQISIMYTLANQYHVVMEVAPQYWEHPQTLNDIYVLSPAGKEVPLSTFVSFSTASTLLSVNHQGQFPAATISFNLLPHTSLGDAVNEINAAVDKMHLPENIHGFFQGTAQAYQSSFATEVYLIIIALMAVYIVLGILYESVIHPITILSTLPPASVGALLALLLFRTDLTIVAVIGIILLIGIVKKNAIMMIDFALQIERSENKSSLDSIYEGALLRFRPITMTTMAALLGALTLVFGFGMGSEIRRPLGITIAGGLIISQMLTLYTTPVIYLTLDRMSIWCRQQWKRRVWS
jgi:multidrug efflux pump